MKLFWLSVVLSATVFGQGWAVLSNTDWRSHAQADAGSCQTNCTSSNYAFRTQAANIFNAWNGAVYDTKRDRYCTVAAGGHGDYYGNEVICLDMTTSPPSVSQVVAPSTFDYSSGGTAGELTADGHLTARHNYGCQVYVPSVDKIFQYSGFLAPGGSGSGTAYLIDPVTFLPALTTNTTTYISGGPGDAARCDFAPWLGKSGSMIVLAGTTYYLLRYDIATNVWSVLNNQGFRDCGAGGSYSNTGSLFVVDPIRQAGWMFGSSDLGQTACNGIITYVDLSGRDSGYSAVNDSPNWTGCSSLVAGTWPAMAFDYALGKFVGYAGTGGTVYIVDPTTKTCVAQPYSGGPTANAGSRGPFSRFAYSPSKQVFIACMDATANCQTLSLGATVTSGLGASTLTCVDRDGDGYGTGPGCLGADADDSDAGVHTGAQLAAKWGSLQLGLNHLGYNPANIWYISPTGNDGTGAVNNAAQPFATCCASGKANPAPGDMVIMRGGTYVGFEIVPPSGTAGNPITILSYPGELPYVHNLGSNGSDAFYIVNKSYIVIDGIKADGGLGTSGCLGGGTYPAASGPTLSNHVEVKHVELFGCYSGIMAFGISDWTIEDSVFHDMDPANGQHGVYIGAHAVASYVTQIRRNLMYNNPWNDLHVNGRFTDLIIEQNVLYNSQIAGISLQEGVSQSFIRSNLVFNTTAAALVINNYDGDCSDPNSTGICPYDQNYNSIENNVMYQTGKNYSTGATSVTSSAFDVSNSSTGQLGDLGHQTVRNNIFVGNGQYWPAVWFYDANQPYLSTSTFANNIFWNTDGSANAIGYGTHPPGCCGAIDYTCVTAAALTTLSNCINSDPAFTNASPTLYNSPSSFNFSLRAGSPAIGAGTPAGAPLSDILGKPLGSPPTIGAYASGVLGNTPTTPSLFSACDLNQDGAINIFDVQLAVNQALGMAPCSTADLQQNGQCNVVDIQRIINATLGASCVTGQ